MPLFEFQCQDCGEKQTVAALLGEEAHPAPCAYCGGQRFEKQVGTFAALTSQVLARHEKTEKTLQKAQAVQSPPQGCPNAQCPSHQGAGTGEDA